MKNKDHYEKTKEFHRISAMEKNGYYDAMIAGRPLKHTAYQLRMRKLLLNILDRIVPNNPDISSSIDAGCGRGDFTIEISKRYPQLSKVCGCDFVKEALTIACKDAALLKNVSFQETDLLNMPYGDNSFDLALCINVLHHIHTEDLEKVLARLAQITRRYLVLEIKNINNLLHRYILPKSLLDINIYQSSITEVTNILKKYDFELIEDRGIFLFNWLSPLVILVYKKNIKGEPE